MIATIVPEAFQASSSMNRILQGRRKHDLHRSPDHKPSGLPLMSN